MTAADREVVIGIDEAGYGPILGPLVVTAAGFEVPAAAAETCLWKLLRRSVTAKATARRSKIPILDSKKLYHRKDGLGRLERSALAFVAAWRGLPPSLLGLLGQVCPESLSKLHEYPWYRDADLPIPVEADAAGIRLVAGLLGRDLNANSILPAGAWSEVLLEGHYNRMVTSTQNKAVVLSGLTLRLVQRVAEDYPGRRLRIYIDKQGARANYAPLLLRAFEDRRLKVLEETALSSAYELTQGPVVWRMSFHQSGESLHLAIALASLISKYLRELLMACFNRYWSRQVPALQPTAGYYEDGTRFLKEIGPHLHRLGIPAERLVRQR
jgi:ribonuclease HII